MTELGFEMTDPDPEPARGDVIGDYNVERKIGRGAFGTVFQAIHPVIGKLVAIKVLARKFSVDPEMVNRFITEARAVNQIRHRNIIDIFSFGRLADGRAYYVMELLEGETLQARLDRDGRLALADALPILRAIGRALDAAHGKGIAHRDLKPDNIFLARDADGEIDPKLLDFGIAKLLREERVPHKTQTGIAMGTAYYMSPEQCHGRDVDHRTDFYAFGCVAYQVLTGEVPIDGADYMEILMRQLSVEPVPPSQRVPELPPNVDEAIAWLMRKEPGDRPPSLAAAMSAFDGAMQTGPVRPMTSPTTSMRAPLATPPQGSQVAAAALADTGMTATPADGTGAPARRGVRGVQILAALGVAIAVGGVAFVALHVGGSDPKPAPPAPAPTGTVVMQPTPTPTPAPRPAQPAQPAPAPGPQTITLHVDGAPADTAVTLAGKALGTVPGDLVLPRGGDAITLAFEHAGYESATLAVTPDHDAKLTVTLHHHHAGTVQPGAHVAPDSHSIENPFTKAP